MSRSTSAGKACIRTRRQRCPASLSESSFDVALANPPYYAQQSIARLFVEGAARLLRPDGRLYLVTKQADLVEPIVAEHFGRSKVLLHRAYAVYVAKK